MKPTPNFVKLARKGELFADSFHIVDVGSACVNFPHAGVAYLRPPGQEDPPPREYGGHIFVHVDQVVFVDTDDDFDSWDADAIYYGARPGWIQVRPANEEFSDSTAIVVESGADGIVDGDVVLLGGTGVGVEGPDGTRIVHVDSVYGVRSCSQ